MPDTYAVTQKQFKVWADKQGGYVKITLIVATD